MTGIEKLELMELTVGTQSKNSFYNVRCSRVAAVYLDANLYQ